MRIGRAALAQVRRRKTPKGDPLEIARIAGIAAAKRTAEWIPLCHPLPLTHIDVTARLCKNGVEIASRVTATAQTGVEMEALVAVSAAALTVYDMCKALDKSMEITDIYLVEKTGGKSGHYRRKRRQQPTMNPAAKTVRVLVVDDNPLVRDLMAQALEPLCEVIIATDGADALLKAVDDPPDLIITDFKMPGLDGRQLYEKLRAREATRKTPFIFVASRGDIEEKLRPLVAAEDFLPKPFFVADLVRLAKKVVDRLHLEKLQQRAARPGVIQGRLEEMGVAELMQSLEMGQKSCRLTLRRGDAELRTVFFRRAVQGRAAGRTRRRRGRVRGGRLDRRRIRDRFRRVFGPHHHHALDHRPADGSDAAAGRSEQQPRRES